MGQFSHPNVVKLYGLVTVKEPVRYQRNVALFDLPKRARLPSYKASGQCQKDLATIALSTMTAIMEKLASSFTILLLSSS